MIYGKIWMRNRLKKIVKNLKIKVKKRVNHVFLHKYKYAFFTREKIHVKNLSYRVEIKSNIVILLINQGISGIFHKLTNEKKCAIISKLIRKNNVFCFRCRKE